MASSFQTHLKICAYKIVTCPNSNCDMKVERMLVDDHMTNVCQWRLIHCGYCNEEHYKCDEEVRWSYMYAPITVKSYGWSGRTGGNWTLSKNYFRQNTHPGARIWYWVKFQWNISSLKYMRDNWPRQLRNWPC